MARRYSRKEKLVAVLASDATTTLAASKATKIPRTTIIEWRAKPEFDSFRQNAREGMAEDALLVARLAWRKLGDAIIAGELEGKDLIFAAGMATEKSQLLSGGATERTENRDVTDILDDHERAALNRAILGELAGRTDPRPAEAAVGPAGEAGAEGTTG